jgi:hypothetical protein
MDNVTRSGARSKTEGAIEAVKEKVGDLFGGEEEEEEEDDDAEQRSAASEGRQPARRGSSNRPRVRSSDGGSGGSQG